MVTQPSAGTKPRPLSPDDVIVVAQVELLRVFPGVVDHAHPGHEVHHLLPRGVVQVVATLVTSVAVDPLQPQLAARRRFIRHVDATLKKNEHLTASATKTVRHSLRLLPRLQEAGVQQPTTLPIIPTCSFA